MTSLIGTLGVFRHLNKQKSDACPNEFAQSDDERYEDACRGCHAQLAGRHHEASLATSKLKGNEEQHVGKERCEGKDEYAVKET